MRLLSRRPIGGGGVGMGQATPGSVGANVVAIDNKIEQAMDLVKTHLLYAVREEVEVLKEKIIDLEKKVFRLETENKLLREYAPPEILQQIQHQHHPQTQTGANGGTTATGVAGSQANAMPSSTSSIPPLQQQQSSQQQSISIPQVQQQQMSQSTINQTTQLLQPAQGLMTNSSTPTNATRSSSSLSSTSGQHQPQ